VRRHRSQIELLSPAFDCCGDFEATSCQSAVDFVPWRNVQSTQGRLVTSICGNFIKHKQFTESLGPSRSVHANGRRLRSTHSGSDSTQEPCNGSEPQAYQDGAGHSEQSRIPIGMQAIQFE